MRHIPTLMLRSTTRALNIASAPNAAQREQLSAETGVDRARVAAWFASEKEHDRRIATQGKDPGPDGHA